MSNIFDKDWFKRSETYTRANTEMKLGWDDKLTGKYSSYLYNNLKAKTLVNSNSQLAVELKNLAVAMGVSNSVTIKIDSKGDTSMTDGKKIIVSKNFEEQTGDDYDTLDLIIGLLCHEASHCLFTDFNCMLREEKKIGINRVVHWLHNVIEDEIIETKLGIEHPGYINFITQMKYYYFDKCVKDIIDKDCVNTLDYIMKLFLFVVRYPKYIKNVDKNILDKYDDLFINIRNIMNDCGCLDPKYNQMTTRLSLMAARQIYELIKEFIKENPDDNDKNDKKQQGQSSGSGAQGEDNSGTSGDDNNDESNNDTSDEKTDKNNAENENSKISKTPEEQEKELFDNPDSVISRTASLNAKCSASSETDKPYTYSKYMNNIEENINNDEAAFGLCAREDVGIAVAGENDFVAYNKMLNEIRPYIGLAKSLIIENDYKDITVTNKFRRNGSLDTNKLADAMMGINTVYQQKNTMRKQSNAKFALVLMLDESGSMSWNEIHDKASQIAIMISEAMKDYREIELYIYGHGDNVIPYYTKRVNKRIAIASRRLQCEQNEAISYKMIIDDVKTQTVLPIVAINITDSAYCAGIEDIKAVVANYTKKNVNFNCICLNDTGWNNEFNDTIYGEDNWVIINEINQSMNPVIKHLAKIIHKNYNKNKH